MSVRKRSKPPFLRALLEPFDRLCGRRGQSVDDGADRIEVSSVRRLGANTVLGIISYGDHKLLVSCNGGSVTILKDVSEPGQKGTAVVSS